jgi:hypothetical protein
LNGEEAVERLKSHLTEGSVQIASGRGSESLVLVDGKPINLPYLLKTKVILF